eukprot:EC821809.1.p2 GENE.EC821809.1~~EC821809.1.p2  ORF type:complete len:57 (+),score=6.08 EC821809.1:271-441(+)
MCSLKEQTILYKAAAQRDFLALKLQTSSIHFHELTAKGQAGNAPFHIGSGDVQFLG